jgi:protein phosphatase
LSAINDANMIVTDLYHLHEIGGKKNQEDYLWPPPGTATPNDRVFIVCDGVGGSQNGEVASKIIADYVGNALKAAPGHEPTAEHITQLLYQAKEQLVAYALENELSRDMATTFSLLVLQQNKAFIAWCGDSRVYHVRNGQILYQTEDHSLVHTLVKSGEITEEEAQHHPHKNIILNAVKADESVIEVTTHTITNLKKGDYFLLCTDGLLEQVTANDLQLMLQSKNGSLLDIAFLIRYKCSGKTRDNYSMYLLQVGKPNPMETQTGFWLFILFLLLSAGGAIAYFIQHHPGLNKAHYNRLLSPPPDSTVSELSTDTIIHPNTN